MSVVDVEKKVEGKALINDIKLYVRAQAHLDSLHGSEHKSGMYLVSNYVKDFLFDSDTNTLILVVDRSDYINRRGFYTAIKRLVEVNDEIRRIMNSYNISKYNVLIGFPWSDNAYYYLSKNNATPLTKMIMKEEAVKMMLDSVDSARKKIDLLNDSLRVIEGSNSPDKKLQLQFLLELLLSQKPSPSNKAVVDDYDLYKLLYNLYSSIYGKMPEKRDIQSVITDENAELFKKIIDRHFLINWNEVSGDNLRDKVINVLLDKGFEVILDILASVNFEMVNLLKEAGEVKSSKKGGRRKTSRSKKKSSKAKNIINSAKQEAIDEMDVVEPIDDIEGDGDLVSDDEFIDIEE